MNIEDMKIRLFELQDDNKKAKKIRSKGLLEDWKDIEQVFHFLGLLYVSKVIHSELINRHHNNPLAGHFNIEKT